MKEGERNGERKSRETEDGREQREEGDFGIMHVVQNNGTCKNHLHANSPELAIRYFAQGYIKLHSVKKRVY